MGRLAATSKCLPSRTPDFPQARPIVVELGDGFVGAPQLVVGAHGDDGTDEQFHILGTPWQDQVVRPAVDRVGDEVTPMRELIEYALGREPSQDGSAGAQSSDDVEVSPDAGGSSAARDVSGVIISAGLCRNLQRITAQRGERGT